MKMWQARFSKDLDKNINDFNSSLHFDKRMYQEDINGSLAHVKMLGKMNIITNDDYKKISEGLETILKDISENGIAQDAQDEDIHMYVEQKLTSMLGQTAKKLHTARSRNDQVATDLLLYVKKELVNIKEQLIAFINIIIDLASNNLDTIMPCYTHLQRAQPTTFAHYLMAYAQMFYRDIERIESLSNRLNECPLGSSAAIGTTYLIDRDYTSQLLGFEYASFNNMDSVSNRDYVIESANINAIIMMHLSRFAEEVIVWSSWEFNFIELDDAFATGSSIMPQKKNPDIAELVRGKSGRVYGDLQTLLVVMKSLPLAYNKDMQEDKEAIFDSIDTTKMCLSAFMPMIATLKVNHQKMYEATKTGFINATDCADYLVKKGLAFRDAYNIIGSLVAYCIDNNTLLEKIELATLQEFSQLFDNDIYDCITIEACVNNRANKGGPNKDRVLEHINLLKKQLER